jgi:hypothetical protein
VNYVHRQLAYSDRFRLVLGVYQHTFSRFKLHTVFYYRPQSVNKFKHLVPPDLIVILEQIAYNLSPCPLSLLKGRGSETKRGASPLSKNLFPLPLAKGEG